MKVIYRPLARSDLKAIGAYIARDNKMRAKTFVAELKIYVQRLSLFPSQGAARDDLIAGLRLGIYGAYNIFYTAGDDTFYVERILHSARDYAEVLH